MGKSALIPRGMWLPVMCRAHGRAKGEASRLDSGTPLNRPTMKTLVRGLMLLLAVTASIPSSSAPLVGAVTTSPLKATETVYVCMSKSSVAYHSRGNCAGINRCTHEVKQMSTVEAQKLGKRACQKCY